MQVLFEQLPGQHTCLSVASSLHFVLSSQFNSFFLFLDEELTVFVCVYGVCQQLETWVMGVHVFRVSKTGAGESPSITVCLLVKPELVSGIIALGAMSVSESKALGGVSSVYRDVF